MAIKTPDQQQNLEVGKRSADGNLGETVDQNGQMEARLDQPLNPTADKFAEDYPTITSPTKVNGHMHQKSWVSTSGGTFEIDQSRLKEAQGRVEASEIQAKINDEVEGLEAEAEGNIAANSASIPPSEPESAEVAELDGGYQEATNVASAEIASINGGVAEEMNAALVQAG